MKVRLLLVPFILCFFHLSYAQESKETIQELLGKGKTSLEQFQLDSAKSLYGRASELSAKSGLWDLHFDAEFNQAMIAFLTRKQAQSDSILNRLYTKVEEDGTIVNDSTVALLNYIDANILWRQGKYLRSRQRIKESLRLMESSTISDASQVKILMIEGNINLHLSNYDQAVQGYLNCINLLSDKEGRLAMFIYNNLGQAYMESRNYQRGMEYYLRGYAVCTKLYKSNHPYNTYFYQNIGNLYFMIEDYENAKIYYNKLIDLSERILDPKDPELAKYYNNVAGLMVEESKYDSARIYLEKSFAILGKGYHRNKRHAFNITGQLMLAEKRYDEALENFNKAFEIEQQVKDGDNHFITQILTRKGKTFREMKAYDSAMAMFNNILIRITNDWQPVGVASNPAIEELIMGYEDEATEALLNKAAIMHLMDEPYEQISATFSLIETLLDKLESDYLSPEEQFNLVEYESELARSKAVSLSRSIPEADEKSLIEEVFNSIERNKARVLKLELESRHSNNLYQLDEQAFEANREILLSIAYHKSIIISSDSQAKIDSLNSIVFNLNRSKDSIETAIRDQYPVAYQKKYGKQDASIATVQEKLNENDLLIQYFISDSAIHSLTISQKEVRFLTNQIPENFEDLVKDSSIQGPDPLNPDSFFALYQVLLAPLQIGSEISKLTIIPDKVLWNVNFELLLTDRTQAQTSIKDWPFLLKQMGIHYAYSASTFVDTGLRKETNGKVLAMSFGDTDTGGEQGLIRTLENMSELPGTRDEIRRISKYLEGDYYFGDNASESTFKQEASAYTILHLALHGETQEGNPNNSRIAFYDEEDGDEDGFLHAFELYSLELGAEMAVLSACQTGEGPQVSGEGIMSIGRAFSSAGVKSLIVSRWKVPDATAPEIMDVFYQELANGSSKSEALRQAKLAYLAQADNLTSHPYYWSSFYVLGSDASLDLSSHLSLYFLVFIAVVIVFIAIQIKRKRSARA